MPEHLTEHVADWRSEVVVEKASRTIRNVALAGADSKNGYRYAEAALKAAAPLYENVPVFLDHPASPHRPRDRSARDLAGSVTNVRYDAGRLRGDLRTLDTEAGRTLLALAEADGPGVGMSHVVLAERSGDGETVERIVEVVSVDAVAFPATTSTFRESTAGELAPIDGVSPAPPISEERKARVDRVRALMTLPERREGAPLPTGQPDLAEQPVPLPRVGLSAPASLPPRPGSIERLLASVDAELPGHLRRLAAAPGCAPRGRGARAGVFPNHVVVEWRTIGGPPEHYALCWRPDGNGIAFGDELVPLDAVAERLGSWGDIVSPNLQEVRQDTDPTPQIERLAEQLREATAERDRLAERLASRAPTSILRRAASRDPVADEFFVRTVRRR